MDLETLGDEIIDPVVRSIRWIIGGLAGGMTVAWIIADAPDVAPLIGISALLLVALTTDLIAKIVSGEYGERTQIS